MAGNGSGISFDLTAESKVRFSRCLAAIGRQAGKTAVYLLGRLTVNLLLSARKDTPVSDKLRKVLTLNTGRDRRSWGGAKWVVFLWPPYGQKATENRHEIPAGMIARRYNESQAAEKDEARRIKWSGAARGAWSGMMRRLYASDAPTGDVQTQRPGGYIVPYRKQGGIIGNVVDYAIKYLAKVRPNIMDTSAVKAMNKTINENYRRAASEIEQAWRTAV